MTVLRSAGRAGTWAVSEAEPAVRMAANSRRARIQTSSCRGSYRSSYNLAHDIHALAPHLSGACLRVRLAGGRLHGREIGFFDGGCRHAVPVVADARAAAEGGVCVRLGGAPEVALHPDRDVRPQRADDWR